METNEVLKMALRAIRFAKEHLGQEKILDLAEYEIMEHQKGHEETLDGYGAALDLAHHWQAQAASLKEALTAMLETKAQVSDKGIPAYILDYDGLWVACHYCGVSADTLEELDHAPWCPVKKAIAVRDKGKKV